MLVWLCAEHELERERERETKKSTGKDERRDKVRERDVESARQSRRTDSVGGAFGVCRGARDAAAALGRGTAPRPSAVFQRGSRGGTVRHTLLPDTHTYTDFTTDKYTLKCFIV